MTTPGRGFASPSRRAALVASIVGYSIDGFDLLILSFMLPAITASFLLTKAEGGLLVTVTLIGAVFGGCVFGLLSDSYGRVKSLSWSILLFSGATGLCGLAQNYSELLGARFIAGLGLGGEFGIGMTLVTEVWPSRDRSRATSYVALGWQGGALAAALLTPILLPLVGWRGLFGLAAFPALFSFLVRRHVNEPEVFLRQKKATGLTAPLWLLICDSRARRSSFALFVLCSVQNFGYYGIMIWLPSYLAHTMSFSLVRSSVWSAATIMGMCIGIISFGEISDRFGRRPAFILFQAGAAAMVVIYTRFSSPTELLFGGVFLGFFANGMIGGYGALISELFPTEARSSAQNVLFNLGRGVGGFGPVVIGLIAAKFSLGSAIALLSSIYILDLLVTMFFIPETKGANLR